MSDDENYQTKITSFMNSSLSVFETVLHIERTMFRILRVPLFIFLGIILAHFCSVCDGVSFEDFVKLSHKELKKFEQVN